MHGDLPAGIYIDHINSVRHENWICNLRVATSSESGANKKSIRNGLKGTYFHKTTGRWHVAVQKNRKRVYIGLFDTELEGHQAYLRAAREIHGEFARAA